MQNVRKRQARFGTFVASNRTLLVMIEQKESFSAQVFFWQLYLLLGEVANLSYFSEFINGVTC